MFWIILLIVLFSLILLITKLYQWPSMRTRKLMSQIPGYSQLDSLYIVFKNANLAIEDSLPFVNNLLSPFPSIFAMWLLGLPLVNIASSEHLEILLKSSQHIKKGFEYRFLEPWLQQGILTSTGSKWHQTRKLLTPAFHFRILENSLPIFNKNVQILIEALKLNSSIRENIKLEDFVPLCTLDIICEAGMGVCLNSQSQKSSSLEYVKAVRRMNELTLTRYTKVYTANDWLFNLTSEGREQKKLLKFLHEFTENVIGERKKTWKLTKENGPTDLKPSTFVDFLLEIEEKNPEVFSDIDIRQEVDTFMLEGHETTSSAIAWTLLLLGHDPAIQQKAYNELYEIFGESDRTATKDDLSKMVYLEAIIKESLRMYPPVSYMSRKLETELDLGKYTLPAGTNISIFPYIIHRDDKFFPNPEKFDPDRFLTNDTLKKNPFLYIPFSGGPRNCIGQKFAMMELKVTISSIIRNFQIESLTKREGLKILLAPFLKPIDGIYVKLTQRF